MKFLNAFVLSASALLASCGGGDSGGYGGGGGGGGGYGGGGGVGVALDSTPPVISYINQTLTAGNSATLSVFASDNVAVTGYCFKTDSANPLATDACFQASEQKPGVSLAQGVTNYVWAKDAVGNVSAPSRGSCSATGFSASNATTKNVVCMLTDKGEVVVELDAAKAPITVANFLSYINAGFYTNTAFHRVISNFVVQGGGFTYSGGAYTAKGTSSLPIVLEKTSITGLSNTRGTIAMARTSAANSATSQFFINVVDNSTCLDAGTFICDSTGNGYAVFGRVIAGLEVVDALKVVATGNVSGLADAPVSPVYVQWAYQVK